MSGALIRWSGTRPLLPAIALFLFCLVWLATAGSANEPPSIVISGPTTRFYPRGIQPSPIYFTVTDVESPSSDLRVFADSSKPLVLAATNMTITGSGSDRSLIIKPTPTFLDVVVVTLTVVDDDGATGSTSLSLFVNTFNDSAPIFSAITDQVIWENTPSVSLNFQIASRIFVPEAILVTASSLNTNLITDSAILLSGSGQKRTFTIHPTAGQTGTCIIKTVISDPNGNEGDAQFLVSVLPFNAPLNHIILEQVKPENYGWVRLTGRFTNGTYRVEHLLT